MTYVVNKGDLSFTTSAIFVGRKSYNYYFTYL